MSRLERFLALSALLTGSDAVILIGTGVAEEVLAALDDGVGVALTDQLLASFAGLPAGSAAEAAAETVILADPRLGPIARNVMLLWLTGCWYPLPQPWRDNFGARAKDSYRVISAQTYQAGLQWRFAQAHPPGALQQGYGAWALAPGEVEP